MRWFNSNCCGHCGRSFQVIVNPMSILVLKVPPINQLRVHRPPSAYSYDCQDRILSNLIWQYFISIKGETTCPCPAAQLFQPPFPLRRYRFVRVRLRCHKAMAMALYCDGSDRSAMILLLQASQMMTIRRPKMYRRTKAR